MKTKAESAFGAGDVQVLFAATDEQAEEFLASNAKHIEDAMTTAGWEAMETLGHMANLTAVWTKNE
jgi:hypothetical protein